MRHASLFLFAIACSGSTKPGDTAAGDTDGTGPGTTGAGGGVTGTWTGSCTGSQSFTGSYSGNPYSGAVDIDIELSMDLQESSGSVTGHADFTASSNVVYSGTATYTSSYGGGWELAGGHSGSSVTLDITSQTGSSSSSGSFASTDTGPIATFTLTLDGDTMTGTLEGADPTTTTSSSSYIAFSCSLSR